MPMHNPPHPGEIIKRLCLNPLGVSVTQAAQALGVSRKALSAVLNGRAGISHEMAVCLSIAFDTSAETWLNQQIQYDLWHAEQRRKQFRVVKLAVQREAYVFRCSRTIACCLVQLPALFATRESIPDIGTTRLGK